MPIKFIQEWNIKKITNRKHIMYPQNKNAERLSEPVACSHSQFAQLETIFFVSFSFHSSQQTSEREKKQNFVEEIKNYEIKTHEMKLCNIW